MFREIRRKERALSPEQCREILQRENYGVLCVNGDEGFPYGVPINYGYVNGKIFLHSTSAESSHKLSAIRRDDKVSFTVISRHELDADRFMECYESVLVFGNAVIVESPAEMTEAMKFMMTGIAPELAEKAVECCKNRADAMVMIEITPVHITGKAGQ